MTYNFKDGKSSLWQDLQQLQYQILNAAQNGWWCVILQLKAMLATKFHLASAKDMLTVKICEILFRHYFEALTDFWALPGSEYLDAETSAHCILGAKGNL